MLKQVQMTRRAGYRLQGMGSREENWQSIQGFNATEEVVRAAVCGSPSLSSRWWLFVDFSHPYRDAVFGITICCHPELVSGSALVKGRGCR